MTELTQEELIMLGMLREWRCMNEKCRKLHFGAPSIFVDWKWCDCGSSSERTYKVVERLNKPDDKAYDQRAPEDGSSVSL